MMTRKTLAGMALAVLATGAVLAGCGSTGGHSMPGMGSPSSTTTAPSAQQSAHNQADVAFLQSMIPHHTQAIDMTKMVAGHTTNAKVIDLAGRIQKAQDPEIAQMTSWLKTWDAQAAATAMPSMPGMPSGHSMPGMGNSTPSTTGSAPMTGMMSDQDMAKLQTVDGAAFDTMWLQMMIQHHQGAIDMSNTELSQGTNTNAKTLAQQIINGQQAQITEMKSLLGQS